ncbi:MAG: hypothetical protein ABID38_05680 [Candidatus Diapherotrites archaeon]
MSETKTAEIIWKIVSQKGFANLDTKMGDELISIIEANKKDFIILKLGGTRCFTVSDDFVNKHGFNERQEYKTFHEGREGAYLLFQKQATNTPRKRAKKTSGSRKSKPMGRSPKRPH